MFLKTPTADLKAQPRLLVTLLSVRCSDGVCGGFASSARAQFSVRRYGQGRRREHCKLG